MSIGITINGKRFDGWFQGKIESSLLTLADSFVLSGANVFTEDDLKAGDEVIIDVAREPIITGYIDKAMPDTKGNITIEGRDKTGDLVDCMAAGATTYIKQSVLSICNVIVSPFGISVTGDNGATVNQFIVNVDETLASALLRIVDNYGMVITSDKDGNMIVKDTGNFTNPGVALREGLNIKTAAGSFDSSKQYSTIKVVGQNYDNENLQASEDGTAGRLRPFTYYLSGEVNQSDCKLSAKRIKDFKDGSACTVIAVPTTLDYYPAGTLITLDSDTLRINADMLTESVVLEFEKESAGITFTLVPPSKYGGDKIECGYLK